MGKKQSAIAVKQRPGKDITRFLERRAPLMEAGAVSNGRYASGVQPTGGRASTPGKHLLDNVLLSQDADDGGMQVVWASSPNAAFSPLKGAGGSQEAASGSQQQAESSQADKDGFRKTLIQAVQRVPSDSELNVGAQLQQPVDDMLEQLLVRRSSHRAASTSGLTAEPAGHISGPLRHEERITGPWVAPKLGGSTTEGGVDAELLPNTDVDLIMQQVLGGTDTYKTPAAGGRPWPAAVSQSADLARPIMCTPSALTIGGKRPLLGTLGKKAVTGGNKRRALLDILDQVELMVKHHRGTGPPSQPSALPKGLVRIEAGTSPTASIVEVQQQFVAEDVGATCPMDSEVERDGASYATVAEDCAPGGRTSADEQRTRVACEGLEPAQLRNDPSSQSKAGTRGVTSGDLTAAKWIVPTQPLDEIPADASVSANIISSDSKGTVGLAAPMDGRIAPGHMLPPASWTTPVAPVSGGDASTQALSPVKVLVTPLQSCRHHHVYSDGSVAAPTLVTGLVEQSPQPGAATADKCGHLDVCPLAAANISMPPVVFPAAADGYDDDDDDDDAFWGRVDVDALVASATGRQPELTGSDPDRLVAPRDPVTGRCPVNARATLPLGPPPQPLHMSQLGTQYRNAHSPQHRGGTRPAAEAATLKHGPQSAGNLCSPLGNVRPPQSPMDGVGAPSVAKPLLGEREEVHFVVLEVEQQPNGHDKTLRCFNEYKAAEVYVCLRDMWADQEVQPGDTVNVVGGRVLPSPVCTTLEVSATEGLLILHPDVLLSGTSVCTAIRCARQAWLQERVASGPGGEKALIGSMLHELLQRSLRAAIAGKLDKNVMMAEARSVVASNTDKLLESHQNEASVLTHITQQLDGIISWCNTYVTPNQTAPHGGQLETSSHDPTTRFCRVTEVLDIEESIWAPKYGLKGQLDASLRVRLSAADPLRPSGQCAQLWSQQEPAHFHGMRSRVGDRVTGVISANRPQPDMVGRSADKDQHHPWSAGNSAPCRVQSAGGPHAQQAITSQSMVVPFEFKTGKDWHEHRAQVLLYLLLMEDRYHTAVRTGLLWNSHKPTMQAVRYAHHELASLIMHRNRLARHLVGAAREPPPPLQGSEADRKCEYCSVSATCALYLAAAGAAATAQSDGAQADAGPAAAAEMDMHQALREKLLTVSPHSAAFFAHWVGLVDLEEHAVRGSRTEMWMLSGPKREQLGGCIAQLLLERELPPRGDSGDGDQRFMYVFKRRLDTDKAASSSGSGETSLVDDTDAESGAGGLLSTGFAPGDSVLLGLEGRHAAAARVTVVDVTRDAITVACRKELKYIKLGDLPRPTCACCSGGASSAALGRCDACASSSERITWRLDRDESASLFAQLRLNLALLCAPGAGSGWSGGSGGGGRKGGSYDVAQARREGHLMQLRKLIIELEAPQQGLGQSSLCTSSQLTSSVASSQLQANSYLREHAQRMNGEQLEAVQRVLAMQDYAILLGMPGTGKTTTIVHIIRALVETRASILVASYTNSAVDNILLKLIGTPVSFVRLGSAQAVHPAIQPYMPGGEHHPDTSVAGLQELMGRVNVVGCTCLSVHHPLLAGRTFSVCILDEASQVTLPASIGALALARSFLLVGDHYQLSPLVVSREAAQGGLGISLFRRLSEAHPQAVVTLRSQYRMAADIMALSNVLVYNGRMICGNESVAEAVLSLPYLENLASYGSVAAQASPYSSWPHKVPMPSWLMALMQPECRVVFLNTDSVAGCREVVLRDGIINRGEVQLVRSIACALVAAGLPPSDIGVASPYKAQVAVLQQSLAELKLPSLAEAAGVRSEGGERACCMQTAPLGDRANGVEVLTVDKYQGRDKSAILLSFVRCNPSRSAGRLLADWQRLNVAITRARTKLVLLGAAATLASIPMLEGMLSFLGRKGWIQHLPVDSLANLPPMQIAAPAAGPTTRAPQ